MGTRVWQIGVVGTFDVENYGDLLFPIVAEAELGDRLGAVQLHRFSYHAKAPPAWPYVVRSVSELPGLIRELDALLIGGGFLIRFDKDVADGYGPPTPAIHHPTGYWLTPALLALQHDVPLIWNGPGMHCNEIPAWAEPLLGLALSLSPHVAVRDQPTRAALAPRAGTTPVTVIPDTAFGIGCLLGGAMSAECAQLRAAAGLSGPYIVIQAAGGLDAFVRFFRREAAALQRFRVLALPIGPVLGNRVELLGEGVPGLVELPSWPHPLLLAELLAEAEAVIGYSYHLAVTALATGVPVFTPQPLVEGKFSALSAFDTIHALTDAREPELDWFVSRVGKTTPSTAVRATLGPLGDHWDRVAAIVAAGRTDSSVALDRFWQGLPGLLEQGATECEAAAAARCTAETGRSTAAAAAEEARAEVARLDDRLTRLQATLSWKVTAPLRVLRDAILGLKGSGA